MTLWYYKKRQQNKQFQKTIQTHESLAQKHKETNERLVESTKNSLKKYEQYLDCTEDVIKFLISQLKREGELAQALLENAYVSQSFEVKGFLKGLQSEEENEILKSALNKISKSSMLKSKGLFQNLTENINLVRSLDK